MYLPPHFAQTRTSAMHALISRAGLATLVTQGPEGLVASHVPVLLDAQRGPQGTLSGHLARANGQWKSAAASECLVIFQGPDAYVSPSAYATKARTGKVVPTWNYVAVHAYGPLEPFEEPERLLALVTRLTERHEAGRAHPWSVRDAPADYVRHMLAGIVGFEVPIRRLEGKWKLSQNRAPEDRAGVIEALERSGTPGEAAVAQLMREAEPPQD